MAWLFSLQLLISYRFFESQRCENLSIETFEDQLVRVVVNRLGNRVYLFGHLLVSLPTGAARLLDIRPVPIGKKMLPGNPYLREESFSQAIE
jgi:hypothetical protein